MKMTSCSLRRRKLLLIITIIDLHFLTRYDIGLLYTKGRRNRREYHDVVFLMVLGWVTLNRQVVALLFSWQLLYHLV